MIDLNFGTPVKFDKELKEVEILIYYDGPILTLFEDNDGNKYLFFLCDYDEDKKIQRHLLIPISQDDLDLCKLKKMSLYDLLMHSCNEGYIVDLQEGNLRNTLLNYITKCKVEDIPVDYFPDEDYYLS